MVHTHGLPYFARLVWALEQLPRSLANFLIVVGIIIVWSFIMDSLHLLTLQEAAKASPLSMDKGVRGGRGKEWNGTGRYWAGNISYSWIPNFPSSVA
jgi:hypothetical protein